MSPDSVVQIGLVLPEVLGTYGDGGNAVVLQKRLEWRGVAAEVVPLPIGEPVPNSLDIYCVGGGEDTAQTLAVRHLTQHPGMQQAAANGSVIFAVCAGVQILGETFAASDGTATAGLGMLDVRTVPGDIRAIGEVTSTPIGGLLTEPLTGFENHQGVTSLGADAAPLGNLTSGVGNGAGDHTEGVVQGRAIGTYMHGPALARNPELADLLLSWVTGRRLDPIDVPGIERLRRERLDTALKAARV